MLLQEKSRSEVTFVYGWNMNHSVCSPLLNLLNENFSVTVPDLPGHSGRALGCSRTLQQWSDDVLSQVSTERSHWIGWSLGGLVMLDIASRYPERVRSFTLLASTPCFVAQPDWSQGMPDEVFADFVKGFAQNKRKTQSRFMRLMTLGCPNDKVLTRWISEQIKQNMAVDPAALEVGLKLLHDMDMRGKLRNLQIPGQFILGEGDPLISDELVNHPLFEGCSIKASHVIREGGHIPFLVSPDAVEAALSAFFHHIETGDGHQR